MKRKAPPPPQRPLPQRERERVLLGLDEAFAITTSATTPYSAAASCNTTAAAAAAAAGAPSSTSSLLAAASTRQGLYEELPARFLVVQTEPNDEATTTATTVEATLQDLLLRNKSGDTAEARLRGKTVQLDNTRGQTEQQKQETRLRRQLLRGGRGRATSRRFSVRTSEEEGGDKNKKNGKGENGDMGRWKKKRGAGSREEQNEGEGEGDDDIVVDYSALEANWQSYMQGLLLAAGGSGATTTTTSTSTTNVYTSKHLALQKAVVTADLHGCPLEVVASKCASEVGLKGTVLRESAGAFHLLLLLQDKGSGKGKKERRRGGEMKIVPKAGRRFEALVMMGAREIGGEGEGKEGGACYRVVLHGNGLVDRARAIASPLLRKKRQGGGGGGGGGDVNERLLRNTRLGK